MLLEESCRENADGEPRTACTENHCDEVRVAHLVDADGDRPFPRPGPHFRKAHAPSHSTVRANAVDGKDARESARLRLSDQANRRLGTARPRWLTSHARARQ